jgi:hypothetical protein
MAHREKCTVMRTRVSRGGNPADFVPLAVVSGRHQPNTSDRDNPQKKILAAAAWSAAFSQDRPHGVPGSRASEVAHTDSSSSPESSRGYQHNRHWGIGGLHRPRRLPRLGRGFRVPGLHRHAPGQALGDHGQGRRLLNRTHTPGLHDNVDALWGSASPTPSTGASAGVWSTSTTARLKLRGVASAKEPAIWR